MNGKRYLLDTNAVIQLLAGNPSLRKMVEDSDFLAISVISKKQNVSAKKKKKKDVQKCLNQLVQAVHLLKLQIEKT